MTDRVFITGAGGVVGQALTIACKGAGQDVVGGASRMDGDLEDFNEARRLLRDAKPTVVYHLAAAVYGLGGNSAFPGDSSRRNLLINTHVVAAAHEAGVRKIVAMGSAAMYPDGLAQPFRESDLLLGEPHDSEAAYAESKRAMLAMLRAYQKQFSMDYGFVVATNMYGPGDRFDVKYGHVVPSLVAKFHAAEASSQEVEVWGDGSPTRDFLFSDDAAAGLIAIMERGEGLYNLASGTSVPIASLVAEVAKAFPGVRFRWDPTRPLGQLRRSYDIARISSLGFAPKVSLAQGVAKTASWYRANAADARRTA